MYMEKLCTTPFFIHFVTQEEDHTFCTLRDFKDKESQGKNGHNLHKIMGEFGQGLNIYKNNVFIIEFYSGLSIIYDSVAVWLERWTLTWESWVQFPSPAQILFFFCHLELI